MPLLSGEKVGRAKLIRNKNGSLAKSLFLVSNPTALAKNIVLNKRNWTARACNPGTETGGSLRAHIWFVRGFSSSPAGHLAIVDQGCAQRILRPCYFHTLMNISGISLQSTKYGRQIKLKGFSLYSVQHVKQIWVLSNKFIASTGVAHWKLHLVKKCPYLL